MTSFLCLASLRPAIATTLPGIDGGEGKKVFDARSGQPLVASKTVSADFDVAQNPAAESDLTGVWRLTRVVDGVLATDIKVDLVTIRNCPGPLASVRYQLDGNAAKTAWLEPLAIGGRKFVELSLYDSTSGTFLDSLLEKITDDRFFGTLSTGQNIKAELVRVEGASQLSTRSVDVDQNGIPLVDEDGTVSLRRPGRGNVPGTLVRDARDGAVWGCFAIVYDNGVNSSFYFYDNATAFLLDYTDFLPDGRLPRWYLVETNAPTIVREQPFLMVLRSAAASIAIRETER